MICYLPSCKIKDLHKEESLIIQDYLANRNINILGCCKVLKHDTYTENDTIINNCTSCAIITDENQPRANEITLYEYVLQIDNFPWHDFKGEKITVQDCFRANDKPNVQLAIRECLRRMNFKIVELSENFENCKFDGPFEYTYPSNSNLKLAPKYFNYFKDNYYKKIDEKEVKEKMIEHCKQYTTDKILVYCNSCLKGVKMGGANGIHMADLLAKCIKENGEK